MASDALVARGLGSSQDSCPDFGEDLIVSGQQLPTISRCRRKSNAIVGVIDKQLTQAGTVRLVERLGLEIC